MKNQTNEKIAIHVSIVTILGNTLLSLLKFIAGIFGHSSAMLSDAVHSFSDVLSTLVVIVGVKIANKQEDHDHPYGHERMECVAALILAIMLAFTGGAIGYSAIRSISNPNIETMPIPSMLALLAAIISILTKEAMFWYTKFAADKINSGALRADAWHHRSDAFSSIGSLIGIAGAQMGYPILDPIASLVICAFILKVAFDIFLDSINKMVDHSCDENVEENIRECILKNDEVKAIDLLKTRVFGNRIYIDVEIAVDSRITVLASHEIANRVHDQVETEIPLVKHCMVHVNPYLEKAVEL